MKKQFISKLLVLCMVLSMLPISALAVNGGGGTNNIAWNGSNRTYSVYDDISLSGTYTIRGDAIYTIRLDANYRLTADTIALRNAAKLTIKGGSMSVKGIDISSDSRLSISGTTIHFNSGSAARTATLIAPLGLDGNAKAADKINFTVSGTLELEKAIVAAPIALTLNADATVALNNVTADKKDTNTITLSGSGKVEVTGSDTSIKFVQATGSDVAIVTTPEVKDVSVSAASGYVITFDFGTRRDTVYLTTDGAGRLSAEQLEVLSEYNTDGYYWTDSRGNRVTVSTSTVFSGNMTLTLNDKSGGSSSGGSGGGGSSSSSSQYTVSVDKTQNGTVTVSPKSAAKGATVTITVKPDEGYELDQLTVTDKDGKELKLTEGRDGKYTFTMPAGKVTVTATFAKIDDSKPAKPSTPHPFTDVPSGEWYADAVQYVYDLGMMTGVTPTTFGPGVTTNRGMIVTMLYRLEGEPAVGRASFTDVAAGEWYSDAVAWAEANGIVNGMTPTTFEPLTTITRQQMATILYRYASFKGYDVSSRVNLSSYTDAGQIDAYAMTAMQWANAEGLITGMTPTTLNPAGSATRAQVATILMRFCENVAE